MFCFFLKKKARDIFSYKHFYVIYCKFWELDGDHDMVIEGDALYRYDRHAICPIAIERVLSGACRSLSLGGGSRKLAYRDFIWFMLSAEDKRSTSGIEYWYVSARVCGGVVLSLFDYD
jgi:serine/threonine-protein phosphatase 2A regulatory subunit B''